ncbi:unnamed protein product [Leptidea sinapis]|uniref:Uncharacterized protein n=1 Tax=Leptidea sinapis TaxID=189913 RepID=A0A5E4PYD8_9NEOP|nr:unnamed protein product [Leptidea sinapis]
MYKNLCLFSGGISGKKVLEKKLAKASAAATPEKVCPSKVTLGSNPPLLHLSQHGPVELYAKNLPRLMQKKAHNRIDQNSSPCKDLY